MTAVVCQRQPDPFIVAVKRFGSEDSGCTGHGPTDTSSPTGRGGREKATIYRQRYIPRQPAVNATSAIKVSRFKGSIEFVEPFRR